MRQPITQEQLDRTEVTAEDEAQFKRMMRRVLDRLVPLVGDGPEVGIAMLRAACQGASLLGLPREDIARVVDYALNTFEARGPTRAPSEAGIEGIYALSQRVMHISAAALRHEPATDTIGVQVWIGVSLLRYNGADDALVHQLLKVSFDDADKATARHAQKHGAKA